MARSFDLDGLTEDDLLKLIDEIVDRLTPQALVRVREGVERRRKQKLEEAKKAVVEEMREKLTALGLSLDDVLPKSDRRGKKGKRGRSNTEQGLPIKYRSPEGDTWSGRGHIPKWLQQLEAEGHSRGEYAVDSGER